MGNSGIGESNDSSVSFFWELERKIVKKLKSVFGIYEDWESAKGALVELQEFGFTNRDLSILVNAENAEKDALAPEKHTKTPQGLAVGAASGAMIGGSLGLLAGLGALVVPGVGPMLAVGPILSALTGMGMGGAAGGIVGVFIGVGIPKHEANYLQEAIQQGGILVAVHVEEMDLKIKGSEILRKHGSSEVYSSDHESISSLDDLSEAVVSRSF